MANTLSLHDALPISLAGEKENLPTSTLSGQRLQPGLPVWELIFEAGLATSRSEARRLVQQGGVYINDERIGEGQTIISGNSVKEGEILIRVGKKKYHKIKII
jgi:tyrosyl-tRNA synthetase